MNVELLFMFLLHRKKIQEDEIAVLAGHAGWDHSVMAANQFNILRCFFRILRR